MTVFTGYIAQPMVSEHRWTKQL